MVILFAANKYIQAGPHGNTPQARLVPMHFGPVSSSSNAILQRKHSTESCGSKVGNLILLVFVIFAEYRDDGMRLANGNKPTKDQT